MRLHSSTGHASPSMAGGLRREQVCYFLSDGVEFLSTD
jgi:hypothetical protein